MVLPMSIGESPVLDSQLRILATMHDVRLAFRWTAGEGLRYTIVCTTHGRLFVPN